MNPNVKVSEKIAVMATMDPASVSASTVVSNWVSMGQIDSLLAYLQTGVLGASATVDAKLRQATDSSGTGAKDVTGKAITQVVKASGDNKQVTIECRDTDLDVTGGFSYVALSVTVGTAASLISATLWGGNPIYVPASSLNQAAVVQQI